MHTTLIQRLLKTCLIFYKQAIIVFSLFLLSVFLYVFETQSIASLQVYDYRPNKEKKLPM